MRKEQSINALAKNEYLSKLLFVVVVLLLLHSLRTVHYDFSSSSSSSASLFYVMTKEGSKNDSGARN
jgi:hypothetical protein